MLASILEMRLLGQSELPDIHAWLLQYPRDSRVLSDFLDTYGCPISRESCSKWNSIDAI